MRSKISEITSINSKPTATPRQDTLREKKWAAIEIIREPRRITQKKQTRQMKIDLIIDLIQDRPIMQAVLLEIDKGIKAEVRIILNSASTSNSSFFNSPIAGFAKARSVAVIELDHQSIASWTKLDKPDVLLTCSESTSPNHIFSRQLVEQASILGIKTIGIQHGYECLGIHHHTSQDNDYPWGVRLSTDYIATWQPIEKLTSISPFTKSRFIPCGPISVFMRLANLLKRRHTAARVAAKSHEKPKKILICDNSHSPRFRISGRRESFFQFCAGLSKVDDVELHTRRHPANRHPVTSSFSFKAVEGDLTPFSLSKFDLIVSPPSSIIIDGAMLGVPTALWSDFAIPNDTKNYRPLPTISTADQMADLIHDKFTLLPELSDILIKENLSCTYGGRNLIELLASIA